MTLPERPRIRSGRCAWLHRALAHFRAVDTTRPSASLQSFQLSVPEEPHEVPSSESFPHLNATPLHSLVARFSLAGTG